MKNRQSDAKDMKSSRLFIMSFVIQLYRSAYDYDHEMIRHSKKYNL